MTYFLESVAQEIYRRFRKDLAGVALIFPNKRAGLFFNEYLWKENKKGNPIWAPSYFSINDFFDFLCPLVPDDPMETICRLHRICQKRRPELSLMGFYSWGQQMMNDFNNVDKNLVDARRLFSNTADAFRLDELQLEAEKIEELRNLFAAGGSAIKDEYRKIWENLYDIYTELNLELQASGTAYQGARYRMVAEGLKNGSLQLPKQFHTFAFVGFNALLKAEQALFDYIKAEGKALFFWDTDSFFMSHAEAFPFTLHLRKNILRYGNALPSPAPHEQPQITFIGASSNNGQARFVPQWLEEQENGKYLHIRPDEARRTAIVLCDETLLQAVLHALPAQNTVSTINITKGFPVSHTPAYAFVATYLDQKVPPKGYTQTAWLEDLQEAIRLQWEKDKEDKKEWLENLYTESYYKCYTTVGRLIRIADMGLVKGSDAAALPRLLLQILRSQNVPFHGEPATGLQIMGMLETRNLDFDHILMLSVNEGNVPKRSPDQSFIPYDLRVAYGLTTGREDSEVYAYNFFRLLQRAKSITYLYNNGVSSSDDLGEKSRFLQQLQIETQLDIQHYYLEEQKELPAASISNVPAETVQDTIKEKGTLSPSALNDYVECPMKFYFRHLAQLRELPRKGQLLQANTLGSIFHEAMNTLYDQLLQGKATDADGARAISSAEIQELLRMENANSHPDTTLVETILDEAFLTVSAQDSAPDRKQWQAQAAHLKDFPSEQLYRPEEHRAERKTLLRYITYTLRHDAQQPRLRIIEMEQRHNTTLHGLQMGGYIDRLDITELDGQDTIRVLDYKTGSFKAEKISLGKGKADEENMALLMQHKDKGYIRQTFIYCKAIEEWRRQQGFSPLPIAPALLFPRQLAHSEYSPLLKYNQEPLLDYQPLDTAFTQAISDFIQHILTHPIGQRTEGTCSYCPFTDLCNKKLANW